MIFWAALLIIKRNKIQKIDNEIYLNDISNVSFKGGKDDTTIATIMTRRKRFRKVILENVDHAAVQFRNKLKELNIEVARN